jgi:hypothetical protein
VADLSEVSLSELEEEAETVAVVSDHGNLTLYAVSELRHNPGNPQPFLEIV